METNRQETGIKNVPCSSLSKFVHPSWRRLIVSNTQIPLRYPPQRKMKALPPALHVSGLWRKKSSVSFFSPDGTVGRSYEAQQCSATCHRAAPGNRCCPSNLVGNLELQQLMAQKQCEQSAFNKCNSSFIQPASKFFFPLCIICLKVPPLYRLVTRWIHKINKTDLGNDTSGMPE